MSGKRRKRAGAEAEPEEEEVEAAEASPVKVNKKKARAEVVAALVEAEDAPDEDDDVEDDDDEEDIVDAAEDAEEDEEEEQTQEIQQRVFRPGVDEIGEDEQLEAEPGTYDMLHKAQVQWPCLSFDIVRDDLGAQRSAYPKTAYVVAGSQAENAADNRIYMMKWSNLRKTLKDGKEDSEDEDDGDDSSDEEAEALLEVKEVVHPGGVNRIRSMPQAPHIVATWSDTGKVHMWNLDAQRKALDKPGEKAATSTKPIFTCEAHKEEGYALDFNPKETGGFLSGSNDGLIYLWAPVKGGWNVEAADPFSGHTSSVEDVQWKRCGASVGSVFASASADSSVCIWDVREKNRKKPAVHIKEAHSSDVNVLSWSPCVGELLATAGDDGGFKVFDTRNISGGPMANFMWHKKPVTSIDWHPTDETMLVLSSEDGCVSLWDMAVEDDRDGTEQDMPGTEHYPAQLMFVHQGQRDPKEVRWHPQLPGVCICTAGSGFNIFKTCNV